MFVLGPVVALECCIGLSGCFRMFVLGPVVALECCIGSSGCFIMLYWVQWLL